jgi:hypothetical protein
VLHKAAEIEVLSLDPSEGEDNKAGDAFHGWKVLGKTTVQEKAVRKKIAAAVARGVALAPKLAAKCFEPRHGIRATYRGTTVDFVICYECSQIEVYYGKRNANVRTDSSSEPSLDRILKRAGVPLAQKPKK